MPEHDIVVFEAQERHLHAQSTAKVSDALPADAMRPVKTVAPDTPISHLLALFQQDNIKAAIVTDAGRKDAKPLGIITPADFLRLL